MMDEWSDQYSSSPSPSPSPRSLSLGGSILFLGLISVCSR